MENLLNGKNIDEIEFQPNTTPIKGSEEFHFGPNSVPLTPAKILDQPEALFTNVQELETTNEDPMSTSFCQDKENDSTNPFDLNKVQVLPDNLEEFLNKSGEVVDDSFNETISDLPLHSPLGGMEIQQDVQLSETQVVSSQLQVTDLDKPSDVEPEQSPELVEEEKLANFLSAPKSPRADSESSFEHIASPVQNIEESRSPIQFDDFSEQKSPAPELLNLANSTSASPAPQSPFPELGDNLPKETEDACQIRQSPYQEPEVASPEPTEEDLCRLQSPNVISPEPKSPVIATPEVSDYLCQSSESKSPVPSEQPICDLNNAPKEEECLSPVSQIHNLPLFEESPVTLPVHEEISSAEEPKLQESNILESTLENEPTLQSDSPNFAQEISNAIQETVPPEVESDQQKLELPADELIVSSPKSTSDMADIESVATTDVNSFLDRSDVPEVESPLNVTEDQTAALETIQVSDVLLPAAAATVAVGGAVAAATGKKTPTPKPKTTAPTAAKKAAPKPASKTLTKPSAPTKTAPAKPAPIKAPAKPLTAASKPSTEKVAPKPRTALTKPAGTEKKPLLNGDAKTTAARTSLTAKKPADVKTTAKSSPLLNKPNLTTRLSGENKSAPRPASAPAKPAPTKSFAPLPKPRPAPSSARSTASSTAKAVPSTASKVCTSNACLY